MAVASFTIEHRITAGSQFNGAAPSTTSTQSTDTGIETFPTGTVGGLFEFDFTNYWLLVIERISGSFADAGTVSVVIVNTAGDEISIYEGATGGDVLITDPVRLAPDEKIKITTTGAGDGMVARVMARPLAHKPSGAGSL